MYVRTDEELILATTLVFIRWLNSLRMRKIGLLIVGESIHVFQKELSTQLFETSKSIILY